MFSGLLVGAMLPFWFSAMTMKSVGKAALAMVEEVRRAGCARLRRSPLLCHVGAVVLACRPRAFREPPPFLHPSPLRRCAASSTRRPA